MNKKEFLSSIDYEDKILLSNIYDKILIHNKTQKTIYINEFYTPNIWKSLFNISKKLGCKIDSFGVFEESDRRMISISSEIEEHNIYGYPMELIRIRNKSNFSKLNHSDFLGALMAQGIKREKFGDLVLDGQDSYVPVSNEVSDYIRKNLVRIGKNPCEIVINSINEAKVPTVKFEKRSIVVTSMRIDSIVSGICGTSRNSSVDMIKKGLVLLDYEKIFEKDTYVDVGTTITVRGYGKFKLCETIGKTQRDREKIIVKKYI